MNFSRLRCLIYCRRGYRLFNPKSKIPFGGAEVELYNLAIAFAKNRNCDVFYLCEKESQFKSVERISGVTVVKILELRKEKIFKPIYFLLLLSETVFLLKKIKPDVILQATAAFETGLLYMLKGKAKFIYRIENDWDVNKDFSKFKPLVSKVYEYGLRHADIVVAQTKYQQELLKENYKKESVLIKNAQVIPKKDELLPYSRRNYFLWVGRLTRLKRPELFVELANRNPEYKFILIGTYDFLNEHIEQVISKAKAVLNLELLTGLNWFQVLPYYRAALGLVITSDPKGEGYPNVMLEAMKHGCPIYSLAWNRDSIIEREGIGEWFGDNQEAFYEGLKGFAQNETQWEIYSNRAYKYAKENHDLDKIVQQYFELFPSPS